MKLKVHNPNYIQKIHESFARQGMLKHLGANLIAVEAGMVSIEMPVSEKATQQHGYLHAGAIASIADTACGYAALSLMPPDSEVLAVEFKLNFLSPATGQKAVAIGQVMKPGQTVTVCRAEVYMVDDEDQKKHCATMLATMIRR